jgi:hypothetical protein
LPNEPDSDCQRGLDGVPGAAEIDSEQTRLRKPVKGRRLAKKPDTPACSLTPEQRLLILDTWQRSGLPALSQSAMHLSGSPLCR